MEIFIKATALSPLEIVQTVTVTVFSTTKTHICALFCSSTRRSFQGLYSQSGKTAYREIAWSLEAARLDVVVFLKLFLRLPVVLSSSPLKILEGFCCGIHSNRIHVIRNDLICFIEESLFCLYNGRKTERIWNYIFQRGQSSMVAIGPGRLCLVKIYIYEKTTFWLKMIWHKIGPSKYCHISPNYTIGHGVSNDAKYSVVYSSHLSMMGTRNWCVTS